MKTFKTTKGTELPFANIKGKDYILVPHRVLWFREDHPDWCIETSRVEATDQYVICRAEIRNADGRIIATAHKREDYEHFGDALEKAETSAVGRALALCGYGTQFAHELEEQDRIVDSPLQSRHSGSRLTSSVQTHTTQKAQVPQDSEVVRPLQTEGGITKWRPEQMKEFALARWGVGSFKALAIDQQDELKALSKSKPFRVAMNDLGAK